jgi:glycolate oxidase
MRELIRDLRRILPDAAIIVSAEARRPYECDGLSAYRELPGVVALPSSVAQVRDVVLLCRRHKVPIVPRGAGTGLSGGALPLAEGLLLSFTKLRSILAVDPNNHIARVQPGVRNIEISAAAAAYGLYYAPDPSSQIACTIGGNVAENSGGVHCLKYGLTVNNVLGLQFLTSAGQLIELGGPGLDAPGYDLLAVVNGSEGLLGLVTEITVRLLPRPQATAVLLAAFDSAAAAGQAVAAIIAAGIIPAGLEMMDHLAITAAEDFAHAGYPRNAAAILLCELDGVPAEVEEQSRLVHAILLTQHATSVRVAVDEAERKLFWAGRKAAFPAVGRLAPDYFCMDGTIPRKQLALVLERIADLSKEFGLAVANVFHAGDGNLHPLVLFDANIPEQLARAEQLGGKILELCVAVGGTVTGEHGVGIEKLQQMCVQFTADELEQFFALKAAFDPEGLLNPGKAIPALQRCAEFGAMHVQRGQLPFPELERF